MSDYTPEEQKIIDEIVKKKNEKGTWETEVPKLPNEEYRKAMKIVEDLQTKYSGRPIVGSKGAYRLWRNFHREVRERFQKELKMNAYGQITVTAINTITRAREECDYKFLDEELMIPPLYDEPVGIIPRVIIDDYEDINTKKHKAEDAIKERENRISMGDNYHIRSFKDSEKG